jgi:hypothetical protein
MSDIRGTRVAGHGSANHRLARRPIVHRVEANINRGIPTTGQSVDMAVEERDTAALFRGYGKVQSRNN